MMRGIRGRNTKPEMMIRKALHGEPQRDPGRPRPPRIDCSFRLNDGTQAGPRTEREHPPAGVVRCC
ncbi:MAG: hypothetical protein F4X98_10375 [Gammaproteobacteria bacterium]|nr:hypothetical protein [Gammaproteobacteria bacterium]